ncbi:MAG: YceI family protein [Acidimicrobiia bacterium]
MTLANTVETTNVPASGTWQVDQSHSDLRITARHLMVAKVRGTFTEFAGTIVVAEDPTQSTVEVQAKAATITTGTPDRDAHLRSPDFLDAEQYPLVTFVSTALEPNGGRWKLTGDLTIRGISRPVTFDMTFEGAATDPYGNTKAAFTAVGEIERKDWGLTWNVPLQGGGVLVSEKFKLEFDVEAGLQT